MSAPSRKAIHAKLIASGLLTASCNIAGVDHDHPDTELIAQIAVYELRWASYSEMWRLRRLTAAEKEAKWDHYRAAGRAMDQIIALPAKTPKGARAKAEFVARKFYLRRGGKPHYSGLYADAASALHDALRGPLFVETKRAPRGKGRQPLAVGIPDDGRLFELIDDYVETRRRARPDDLWGWGDGPDPATREALRRMIALQADLALTPARTWPGIYAKLRATMPSEKVAPHWAPLRSAIADALEVGLWAAPPRPEAIRPTETRGDLA